VNHIGPQFRFPVPEGILNYDGGNYLALTLWPHETGPVKLEGLNLEVDAVIKSGYRKPSFVKGESYTKRNNSY
jgi:beta-galactosidase